MIESRRRIRSLRAQNNGTRYQILTDTLIDGWVNVTSDGFEPVTFPTEQAARDDLADHIRTCRAAGLSITRHENIIAPVKD